MCHPSFRRLALFLVVLTGVAACGRTPTPPSQPRPATRLPAEARGPGQLNLIVPVAGVHPHQLRDSYNDPRAGGRRHWAIDIRAPQGTPVLAAADGIILKLHQGNVGGIAIYQLDSDGITRYYYAHLERYASGLAEGNSVYQGQVIGYVGDTGNAGAGNYHLHFSVAILEDVRRWWEGVNLNPYPILRGAAAER